MRTAVLIPCRNEEKTVGEVVKAFRKALPDAEVYVYDNASSDDTGKIARDAGAKTRYFPVIGKGSTVRAMLEEIDADAYLLVDGDGTYDAKDADALLQPIYEDGCDMTLGIRTSYEKENHRPFHTSGNRLVTVLVDQKFGKQYRDVLTGYRALSKNFVDRIQIGSKGFELETELCIKAETTEDVPVRYKDRDGTKSKLHTIRDGIKILWLIGRTKQRRA